MSLFTECKKHLLSTWENLACPDNGLPTEDNSATGNFRPNVVAEAKNRHRISIQLYQHTHSLSLKIMCLFFLSNTRNLSLTARSKRLAPQEAIESPETYGIYDHKPQAIFLQTHQCLGSFGCAPSPDPDSFCLHFSISTPGSQALRALIEQLTIKSYLSR